MIASGGLAVNLDGFGIFKLVNMIDPTANQDYATKKYHDDNVPAGLIGHIRVIAEGGNGAIAYHSYLELNAITKQGVFIFNIDDDVDDSTDIKIRFVWKRKDANNDTIAMELSVGATKIDGSEAHNTTNIENATAIAFDACVANNLETYVYTLVNANYNKGDEINIILELNEARHIQLYYMQVQFPY